MQFRLTYEGLLLASQKTNNPAKATHKQEIRKVFHVQLKQLWEQTPYLGGISDDGNWRPLPDSPFSRPVPKGYSRAEDLATRFRCGPYRLVPLVTEELSLICGVDILFLGRVSPEKLSLLATLTIA